MFLFGTFQPAAAIRKSNLTLLFHSCHNSLDGLLEVLGADFDVRISEKKKKLLKQISRIDLAAMSAASLHTFEMSAPENPGV